MEDLERRLVAVQPKLTLELDGRHAWRMARNEVCGPEPNRQRRAGPLHDRASCQRVIPLTFATPENVRPVGEAVGFARFAAPSADKSIAPADRFKVSGAIPVVTKEALELGERTRKRQICGGNTTVASHFRSHTTNCDLGCQPDKHGRTNAPDCGEVLGYEFRPSPEQPL